MKRGVMLGIDFSADYTQVSILNDSNDTEINKIAAKAEEMLIPTAMFYNTDLSEWAVGFEAYNRSRVEGGVFMDRIPEKMKQSLGIKVDGKSIKWEEIAELFFDKVMRQVLGKANVAIKNVVISVDDPDEIIMQSIYGAMSRLGFETGTVRIVNHAESFAYYVLNQNKDIWVNNVIMVDFNEAQPVMRKMFVTKGREPFTVDIVKEDISDRLTYSMLDTEEGRVTADNVLRDILENEIKNNIVSGIYLNGQGFIKEGWYSGTVSAIYSNRRIFAGNNLISKGAVFAAKEIFINRTFENYVISCKGRTKVNVTMDVVYRGQETRVILSKAGMHWYEAGAKTQCIINNVSEAAFTITWPATKRVKNFTISLEDFPKRENKTSRIEVSLSYKNENTIVIEIKDIGFGEFFEATDVAVRHEVQL